MTYDTEPKPSEPVLTRGTVTSLITALFALLVSFGMSISDDRQSAILGFVAVAGPLVAAFWSRGKVKPVADIRREARARR